MFRNLAGITQSTSGTGSDEVLESKMRFEDYLREELNVIDDAKTSSPEQAIATLIYQHQRAKTVLAAADAGLDVSRWEDFRLVVEGEVDYPTLIAHTNNFYGMSEYTGHGGTRESMTMVKMQDKVGHLDESDKLLVTYSISQTGILKTVMVTVQPVA